MAEPKARPGDCPPESGHGVASVLVAVPAHLLVLVARGLTDRSFAVVAGWAALLSAVGLALGIRGALAPARRRRAVLLGLGLHAAVAPAVIASMPGRDSLGRSWAMLLGAGILLVVLLASIALDLRRSKRLGELAQALKLGRHGDGFRGLRRGARVEIDPAAGRVTVSVPGGACFELELLRRQGRAGGIETGDAAFDAAFAVTSTRPDAARALLDDASLRQELQAFFALAHAGEVQIGGPHGPIALAWTALGTDVGELRRAVDAAAALSRHIGQRALEVGPVLVEGGAIRVRPARLADWPGFALFAACELVESAPEISLWLEQERVFRTRIDPLPAEGSLAGRWLRLWIAFDPEHDLVLSAEIHPGPWFDPGATHAGVRFVVRSLDGDGGERGRALVPRGPAFERSAVRVCGACPRCGEPYTLAQVAEASGDVLHCAGGRHSLWAKGESALPACAECASSFARGQPLCCLGCGHVLLDAELLGLGYHHASVVLQRA